MTDDSQHLTLMSTDEKLTYLIRLVEELGLGLGVTPCYRLTEDAKTQVRPYVNSGDMLLSNRKPKA
jgi:hypothetical protein